MPISACLKPEEAGRSRQMMIVALASGGMGLWLWVDCRTHDPPPLGDHPGPGEAQSGVQLLWAGVQVGAALRRPAFGLLGIGLDHAASGPLDLLQRGRHRSGRDTLRAVFRIGEDAADPPVRWSVGGLLVNAPALDVG